jgi:hypothetical protein
MVCVVLSDKKGVSKSVTDKDILFLLKMVNEFYKRDAYEVEEFQDEIKSSFFKRRSFQKSYRVYWDCNGYEWQVMISAGKTQGEVSAYLCGLLNGLEERKNDPRRTAQGGFG